MINNKKCAKRYFIVHALWHTKYSMQAASQPESISQRFHCITHAFNTIYFRIRSYSPPFYRLKRPISPVSCQNGDSFNFPTCGLSLAQLLEHERESQELRCPVQFGRVGSASGQTVVSNISSRTQSCPAPTARHE